ncbi:hypothetical protein [Paenibacillus wenxiniae]|uniref:Uncharacterized protein n=1 Tax=Paenibacillus wenxiniae TaxID=1636843 RepID=A0ABW4RK39_9BACL
MLKLVPEKVNFYISTTDLTAMYTESSGVTVTLDVQTIEDWQQEQYRELALVFQPVAELRCVTLNLFEHVEHTIELADGADEVEAFWKQYGYHPDPGLYEVQASEWLSAKQQQYDPKKRLQLKHYVIAGYDSHIEIIASGYTYRMVEAE